MCYKFVKVSLLEADQGYHGVGRLNQVLHLVADLVLAQVLQVLYLLQPQHQRGVVIELELLVLHFEDVADDFAELFDVRQLALAAKGVRALLQLQLGRNLVEVGYITRPVPFFSSFRVTVLRLSILSCSRALLSLR